MVGVGWYPVVWVWAMVHTLVGTRGMGPGPGSGSGFAVFGCFWLFGSGFGCIGPSGSGFGCIGPPGSGFGCTESTVVSRQSPRWCPSRVLGGVPAEALVVAKAGLSVWRLSRSADWWSLRLSVRS